MSDDWTVNPHSGRSNDSREFHQTVVNVARVIRDSAHALLRGDAIGVARLIVAQFAHNPDFAPVSLVIPDAAAEARVAALTQAFTDYLIETGWNQTDAAGAVEAILDGLVGLHEQEQK